MPSKKSVLYNHLKGAGWLPEKHFREYSIPELQGILAERGDAEPAMPDPPRTAKADPDEMPNARINAKEADEVIRVDEQGRQWLQEEVKKPAYPKPRGRRVLKYQETGVAEETVKVGDYTETFEVPGQAPGRISEIKITLPSFQVGIYRDPRFPFKVHTYDGREGFALRDVEEYYGGAELVPTTVKRIYIENDLCYDVRSVIRAIQEEANRLRLQGRM